jgi:hypothetical protein
MHLVCFIIVIFITIIVLVIIIIFIIIVTATTTSTTYLLATSSPCLSLHITPYKRTQRTCCVGARQGLPWRRA